MGPGLLAAAVQAMGAGEQHDGLQKAAEVGPLRRPHAAVDREKQSDRRTEELEVAGILPDAPRAVLARHAERAIEQFADLEAAGAVGLLQVLRIDLVFGALAARQQFGPGADQRLEFLESRARDGMHAPRL